MRISLCIVSADPELFENAVRHAVRNAVGPIDLFAVGNGCELSPPFTLDELMTEKINSWKIVNSKTNDGVPKALDTIWRASCTMVDEDQALVYIHDDLLIHEKGWDQRVARAFSCDRKCGLAGFGGATALGGDEIYKIPYEVHQLGRRNFFSNMRGAEAHGVRVTKERPIVFTDGQSMIIRRSLLVKTDGWSWWPFHLVHHAYDYGIACMAKRHGYTARLVPCDVEHLGGRTACTRTYFDLADQHGGDAAVHAASHKFVYDTFRDVLPLRL